MCTADGVQWVEENWLRREMGGVRQVGLNRCTDGMDRRRDGGKPVEEVRCTGGVGRL